MELNATSLIDVERLQAEITAMYRDVARGDDAGLHFDIGRPLAERLGYPARLLDAIPAEALDVVRRAWDYHLDLAALRTRRTRCSTSGRAPGTDVFCAAVLVGESGPGRRGGHDRRAGRQGLAAAGPQ